MIKRLLISIIICLFFSIHSYTQVVTQAESDSKFERGKYEDALPDYLTLFNGDTTNYKMAYQIIRCYRNIKLKEANALPYIERLIKLDAYKTNAQFYFEYGMVLFYMRKFEEAMEKFNQSIAFAKDSKMKNKSTEAINTCINALALIKTPLNVQFINVGSRVNTRLSEINPLINKKENLLYFSTSRRGSYDVFLSKKKRYSENWTRARNLSNEINTFDNNEYLAGMSPDGNTIFIHYDFNSIIQDIRQSELNSNSKEPMGLGRNINTPYHEEGATITAGFDTLYFASDKPGGYGGFDIYYSIKLPNGDWGLSINLGQEINSPADENYPSLSEDGKTLYFASNGYNSMGGYDIYISTLDLEQNKWSRPRNLGYPINDVYDNLGISIPTNKRYGYVSAYHHEGLGESDIYKVIFNNIEPEFTIYKGIIAVADTMTNMEPRMLKDVDTEITIKVFKKNTDELYGQYAYNKNTGAYIISFTPGEYLLTIESYAYQPYNKEITITDELYVEKEVKFDINLFLKTKTGK